MKIYYFLFAAILTFGSKGVFAQKTTPAKFTLELALYLADSPQARQIELVSYALVKEDGMMQVQVLEGEKLAFYNFQLSQDQVKKISNLLNKSNALKNNMISNKLAPNEHYAGEYHYVEFTSGSHSESLCFIESFMSKEFNTIYDELIQVMFSGSDSSKTNNPNFNTQKIAKKIALQNSQSTYLPPREMPPPEMD